MFCKYCEKNCKNKNSLINHERLCKYNPNKQISNLFKEIKNEEDKKNYYLKLSEKVKGKKYEEIYGIERANELKKKNSIAQIKNQKEHPRKHSKETKDKIAIAMIGNNYGCGRGKKQLYKGILFKSSWEVLVAKYLDEKNIKWVYEYKTYDISEKSKYTPDFFIFENDKLVKIIEVKGYEWKYGINKFQILKEKTEIPMELWNKKKLKEMCII